MKKFKLSLFLDSITLFILIFAVSFIFIKALINNFVVSALLAISLGILSLFFQNVKRKKKQKKLKLKKDIETHINDCSDTFLFNTFSENAEFFKEMLNKKYDVEIRENFLLLTNEKNCIALFPAFLTKKLNQDILIDYLRSVKSIELTKIIILCYDYDINVATISSNYKVKTLILNKFQTYNDILCKFNTFPEKNNVHKIDEKITFSFLLRNALSRNKVKTYFLGGCFLLLGSFIIRYNVYYIIFSAIMFILSLLSLILNRFYFTSQNEIL